MVDSIGGFNFREQLPKLKGSNVPKDAQGLFDKFKKIKANGGSITRKRVNTAEIPTEA